MPMSICFSVVLASLESLARRLAEADTAVFRAVNGGLACRGLDHVMVVVTYFGLGVVQSGIALLLLLMGTIADRLEWRRAAYAGMIAFAVSGLTTQVVKSFWDRPRPVLALFDVRIVGSPLFVQSFPSGHAATAFAGAMAVSAFVPALRWPLMGLALATALSRVYLGVHFPLDVVCGAILGVLIGTASARLVGLRKPRTGAAR